jgi:DNA processing protein
MTARDARIRLAFVGMHPARRRELEARLGSEGLLEAILGRRIEVPDRAVAAAGVAGDDRLAGLGDVRLVLAGDDDYPAALADLPDRPDALFVRGRLPDAAAAVAIVGSRRATRYGVGLARALAGTLGRAGWPIVSGLAAGIDGAAHRGALDADAPTVAVLGNGPDRWYPAAHRSLGEALLERGGAVVTEYAPGAPPAPWRFPLRNRFISGLSVAIGVVEAATTGGALITARSAAAQGREVLAVPGDIDRPTSAGANALIADGAIPITSIDDVVEAMSLLTGRRPETTPADPLADLLGPTGATFDELVTATGEGLGRVLAAVGRWEVEGLVSVDGDRVVPRRLPV